MYITRVCRPWWQCPSGLSVLLDVPRPAGPNAKIIRYGRAKKLAGVMSEWQCQYSRCGRSWVQDPAYAHLKFCIANGHVFLVCRVCRVCRVRRVRRVRRARQVRRARLVCQAKFPNPLPSTQVAAVVRPFAMPLKTATATGQVALVQNWYLCKNLQWSTRSRFWNPLLSESRYVGHSCSVQL